MDLLPICNLCQSDNAEKIYENSQGAVIVKCEECGFMYHWPRVSDTTAGFIYDEDYYRNYRMIDNDARVAFFQERFEKYIKQMPPGNALDVGCGSGDFLVILKNAGWDVYGVELSPWAAQHVRQTLDAQVEEVEVQNAGFPADFFDLVHMNHVLEHTVDPFGTLTEVSRMLRTGGKLIIEVPNEMNLRTKISLLTGRGFKPVTPPPEHVNFFTTDTLQSLIGRVYGLDLTSMQQESLGSHLRRKIYSTPCNAFSVNAVKSQIFFGLLSTGLDLRLKSGDFIIAVAKKMQVGLR